MSSEKQERLEEVRARIRAACARASRKESDVTLIAVSKTKPWEDIEAFASLGVREFGENYVQEALTKQEVAKKVGAPGIRWHLIGTLQSNKAKFVPGNFCLFHALNSASLAAKLDKAAGNAGIVQDCLFEVNVDLEATKGGVEEKLLAKILEEISPLKNIRVRGLMCIPAPIQGRDQHAPFRRLRELKERLNASNAYREKLTELSMGMSSDFEAAIEEGATFLRVGTTLFGERSPK
ncbi:MAG TPA: YggS family pyridoxal phosphate-dependent enzyme [Bdellovibrionota bacterium]